MRIHLWKRPPGKVGTATAGVPSSQKKRGKTLLQRTYFHVLMWISLGVSCVFISLYFSSGLENPPALAETYRVTSVAWQLLEKLGVTLIVFGLLDLAIHLPDWNEYFLDRVRDSIVEEGYLRKLDKDALKDLANRAFQAQQLDPNIDVDKEGSFLGFFYSDLYNFIESPYRENVDCEITCQEDGDYFLIEDKISYTCRQIGSSIQENVHWHNDPGEIADVTSIKIWLKHPGISADGKRILLASHDNFKFVYLDEDSGEEETHEKQLLKEESARKTLKRSFLEASLVNHRKDGIEVTIEAAYRIRRERFQYWQMAHPTKNLTLTLGFPEGYDVQAVLLITNDAKARITKRKNYYRLRYDDWVLPNSGICWRFFKKDSGDAQLDNSEDQDKLKQTSKMPPFEAGGCISDLPDEATGKPLVMADGKEQNSTHGADSDAELPNRSALASVP